MVDIKSGQIWKITTIKRNNGYGSYYDWTKALSIRINKISDNGYIEGIVIDNTIESSTNQTVKIGSNFETKELINQLNNWSLIKYQIGWNCYLCNFIYENVKLNSKNKFECWKCQINHD